MEFESPALCRGTIQSQKPCHGNTVIAYICVEGMTFIRGELAVLGWCGPFWVFGSSSIIESGDWDYARL